MKSLSFLRTNGLSGNTLKIIAIVAMTIDHVAWLIYPGYPVEIIPVIMHVIGRITAPVMMFMVSEGYHYTHDRKKYLTRLLIFAAVSHVPYTMFSSFDFIPGIPTTSVMWPFALGITALMIDQGDILPNAKHWQRTALIWVCFIIALPSDWSTPAVLSILYMGRNFGNRKQQIIHMASFLSVYAVICGFVFAPVYGLIHLGIIIPVLLIMLYSGKRGAVNSKVMKWMFYIYYPAHLLVLGLIKFFIIEL